MRKPGSITTCTLVLPLVIVLGACGGGGGEPGGSPHAANDAGTKLHPYVERWWNDCAASAGCAQPAAQAR